METVSEHITENQLLTTAPMHAEDESRQSEIQGILDSPLKNLKAIILSLEWELSQELLKKLDNEIDALVEILKADKAFLIFLRILRSLGKYIDSAKAKAHPDSIKLLFAVYNNLEKTFLATEMTLEEKATIAFENAKRYNELRLQISALNNAKRNSPEKEESTGQFSPTEQASDFAGASKDSETRQDFQGEDQEIVPALSHLGPLPDDKIHTRFEETIPDVENCLDDFFNADMTEEETAGNTSSAVDETPTQDTLTTKEKEQTNDHLSDDFLEDAKSQLDIFFHEKPSGEKSDVSPAMDEEPLQSREAPPLAVEEVETPVHETEIPDEKINGQHVAHPEQLADEAIQSPMHRQSRATHESAADLNSIIERINGHIDGYTRKRLHEEIRSLQKTCGDDSGMQLLLDALDIIGEHIFIKGRQADKHSLSLFHSIHDSIGDLLSISENNSLEKPDKIYNTIHAFLTFQSQVVLPELTRIAEGERRRKEIDEINREISSIESDIDNPAKPTIWKAVRIFVGLQ